MKKLLFRVMLLIIIAAAVYLYLFSFHSIENGKVGMVEDFRNGRIVRTFDRDYNFIWQGAFPWIYSVYQVPSERVTDFNVMIPVPQLGQLAGDSYSVIIPLSMNYSVNYKAAAGMHCTGQKGSTVENHIKKKVRAYIAEQLRVYMSPVYRYVLLTANVPNVVKKACSDMKESLEKSGINIISLGISGSIQVPDMNVYYDGLRQRNDLRMIEKKNEKELKIIRTKIERDKLLNQEFYSKLREMSGIIKENPDILKYIYIEKLVGNDVVKIIHGPDGYPGFLDKKKIDRPADGEIDNLR